MDVVKRIKTEKFRTRGGTKNGFKGMGLLRKNGQ